MVRVQARALVLVIVVEGQLPAGGVGQLEHGIQRRIEPAGIDFGDDLLAGAAFETEHVPVARLIDAPVDDDRQRDALGVRPARRSAPVPGIPAACRRANGTRWRPASCCARRADRTPGALSLASTVSLLAGRFQPFSSTVVCAPAGPPSGKMLVTNGSSPTVMR